MDLHAHGVLLRARLALAGVARRHRSELERELGTYTTQSDRDDLLAAFDRYPDAQTAELREILARQVQRPLSTRLPCMGR